MKCEGQERFAFDMRAYAKDIVQEYATLTGTTVFGKSSTPFLAKAAEQLDDLGRSRRAASTTSKFNPDEIDVDCAPGAA